MLLLEIGIHVGKNMNIHYSYGKNIHIGKNMNNQRVSNM